MTPASIIIDTPTENQEFSFTGSPITITVSYTATAGDNDILYYMVTISNDTYDNRAYCEVVDNQGGDVTWTINSAAEFTDGTYIVRVIAFDDEGYAGISADRTITIRDNS